MIYHVAASLLRGPNFIRYIGSMNASTAKVLNYLVENISAFLVLITVIGLAIGKFKYRISLLQPLEKIAYEQREYRRRFRQERLKKAISERHLSLGNSFVDVGNLPAAKSEFEAALAVDPLNEMASLGLFKSKILDNTGKFGFTSEVLEKKVDFLLRQNPNDYHGYYFLGLLYRDIDHVKAMEFFTRSIQINPKFPDGHYRIGMLYETVDALPTSEAFSYYNQALNLSKLNQNYLNNVGYQYFQRGMFPEAIEKYQTLVKLDPTDILPQITLSTALLRSRDLSSSVQYADLIVERIQQNATLLSSPLNSLQWFFETYDGRKILLDTATKKVAYCYLTAFYKNLALGRKQRAKRLAEGSLQHFKANPIENEAVIKLIQFEVDVYLRGLVDGPGVIQAIDNDLHKALKHLYPDLPRIPVINEGMIPESRPRESASGQ
jgi:tetratricopeptide (TPR) repeat protein